MPRCRRWMFVPLLALTLALAPAPAAARGGDIAVEAGITTSAADYPGGLMLGTLLGYRPWPSVGFGTRLLWRSAFREDVRVPGSATIPVGQPANAERTIRNAKLDAYPLYAHVYASLGSGPIRGLVGVGGGWQVAFLEGDAFTTQTLGGWGGTVWLTAERRIRSAASVESGIGLHMAYDLGAVERDAFDPALGATVRQRLDLSALSVALSLRMAFAN